MLLMQTSLTKSEQIKFNNALKRSQDMFKWDLIQGCRIVQHLPKCDTPYEQNSYDHPTDAEKALDKILFVIKIKRKKQLPTKCV